VIKALKEWIEDIKKLSSKLYTGILEPYASNEEIEEANSKF